MKSALLSFAAILLGQISALHAVEKPNVLLIIAHQWRAQAFGFAGDPNVKTPNINRFERECVNFTEAVAGLPVCSPTRPRGLRATTHTVRRWMIASRICCGT
jgi:hypothetical protein